MRIDAMRNNITLHQCPRCKKWLGPNAVCGCASKRRLWKKRTRQEWFAEYVWWLSTHTTLVIALAFLWFVILPIALCLFIMSR